MDLDEVDVPVYPVPDDTPPVAGEPYVLECVVNDPGLTNIDILWAGPDSVMISATSGRVTVGDVFQDSEGRSVRRLTFNPLSTEDSGPYSCISPRGTSIQTLTVNSKSNSFTQTNTHTHTHTHSNSL